jgi:hypothetical protein
MQPCGKRLKALLPDWLSHYEVEHGKLDSKVRKKLLTISAAQIDRLLAARKVRGGQRGRRGTKPGVAQNPDSDPAPTTGTLIGPGFPEADTAVAHCGGSLEGDSILERDLLRHLEGMDLQPGGMEQRRPWHCGSDPLCGGVASLRTAGLRHRQRERVPELASAALFSRAQEVKRLGFHSFTPLQEKRQRAGGAEKLDTCEAIALAIIDSEDPALVGAINGSPKSSSEEWAR